MYKEYKNLNLPAIDKEVLAYWEANQIFEKSVDQRDEDNLWVFYEGPPSANGVPGIHHVMGGVAVDTDANVLNLQSWKMEGLFAAFSDFQFDMPLNLFARKSLGGAFRVLAQVGFAVSVVDG